MNQIQDGQPQVVGLPAQAGDAGADSTIQGQPTTGGSQPLPPGQPTGGAGGQMFIFLAMIGVLVLMMVLSGRAKKKEEAKKASMLSTLKRHDRVQTIGGIIATVSEVRDTEVVLTIDEQSKARLRVAKSAIQQVLREAAPSGETPAADASRELAAQAAG